jgi:hypothetical protein
MSGRRRRSALDCLVICRAPARCDPVYTDHHKRREVPICNSNLSFAHVIANVTGRFTDWKLSAELAMDLNYHFRRQNDSSDERIQGLKSRFGSVMHVRPLVLYRFESRKASFHEVVDAARVHDR